MTEASRPERFINHLIDYRTKLFSQLASKGTASTPYLDDAIYYDVLANDPDKTDSLDEYPQLARKGVVYEQEPTKDPWALDSHTDPSDAPYGLLPPRSGK